MKIKELKELIKDLPDDMDVYLIDGHVRPRWSDYGQYAKTPMKIAVKLVRSVNSLKLVQSRPHKDPEASLSLIIE